MADVEAAVRAALSRQGFGVLTEIDIARVLADKLGIDRRPLKILGACNPSLVAEALAHEPDVALALPCNVVLEEVAENRVTVSVADPRAIIRGAELSGVAADGRRRLVDALADVATA